MGVLLEGSDETSDRAATDACEESAETVCLWGIKLISGQWTDFYCSQNIEKISGYSLKQLHRHEAFQPADGLWFHLIHPDDLPSYEVAWARLPDSREMDLEYRIIRPSGKVRWVHNHAQLVQSNSHLQFAGILTDITERKLIEEEQTLDAASYKAAQEWRLMFDAVQSPILIVDLDGRIKKLNGAARDLLGSSFQNNIGKLIDEVGTGQPWQEAAALVKLVRASRSPALSESTDESTRRSWEISASMFAGSGVEEQIAVEARDITERKQAENAIRASEERYRDLFDNANDIVYTVDLDGNFTSVNKAAERISGYPSDQKLNFAQLVAPHHHHLVRQMATKRLAGESVLPYEMDMVTKDGRTVTLEVNSRLIYEEGQPAGIQGIARDVTERKQAEQAVSQLAAIVQSSDDAIIGATVDGMIVTWNAGAERIYGYSAAEAIGRPVFMLAPPDRLVDVTKLYERVKVGESINNVETVRVRKDGTRIYISLTLSAIRTAQGEMTGIAAIARDITDHKRSQVQLQKSEERFRTSIENMLDAFAILSTVRDASGRILDFRYEYINEAGCRSNLITREEIIGKTLLDVLPSHKESGLFDEYCQVVETGVPLIKESLEYEDVWAGRRLQRTFDSQVTKLGDGLAIAWRDITERKHLEQQLRQSQKMETAGRLAGGVAHDFNNLLTAIMGYSELLASSLDERDPLRKHVDQIIKAGERAASLTGQLLAFSRKQVLQPKVFDLSGVVSDIEKMLRRLIGEDIELRTLSAPELGAVKADPGQIEQVLLNLAVNARDAMPHGGRLIVETANVVIDDQYLRRHSLDIPAGPYVMLSVSDTGCGMDKKTQSHIFEPFFTTKDVGKGTGLGLSIVYGIVSQTGGGICVHSTPGAGTTFEVYLPQVERQVVEQEKKDQVASKFIAQETILLAEDEEVVRKLVCSILQMRGYTVLEASSGDEALRVCATHSGPIHLMLTDVVMPKMSGRELAERFAQFRPEVKVLFMSGYTDDAILHLGVSRESLNFIQKPFTPGALAGRVRELLDATDRDGNRGANAIPELSGSLSLHGQHSPARLAHIENETVETIH